MSFLAAQLTGLLKLAGLLLVVMVMSACSSAVPERISVAPENAPQVDQVRQHPEAYQSRQVRWGGIILGTENRDSSSRVTVIALPLRKNGKPQHADSSPGRFIAVVDEFLEPLLYSRDRRVTFSGTVLGVETLDVGEFPYQYPLIRADVHHLWPEETQQLEPNYPYYWPYNPRYYPPWPYPRYPHLLVPHNRNTIKQ